MRLPKVLLSLLATVALGLVLPASARAQTGTIVGHADLPDAAPRRTASRYPGAAPAARTVQDIPAIAFIRGAVAGAPAGPAPDAVLAQQDTAFAPSVLVVPVGTTVQFPNRDPFFHNVFSYSSAARFDLGRYPRGESKSVEFDEPGVVKVYCEVHETMRAAVAVVENPFHTIVAPDGSFRLSDVPPGRYTLVVWHHDAGVRAVPVDVRADATTRVEVRLR